MEIVTNVDIRKQDNAEVEITGEVPVDALPSYRKQAIEKLAKETEVDGFRPGKVPEEVLVKNVGEEKILWEVAQHALHDAYVHIIKENELDTIGAPQVTITKLAAGNPIGFKITSALSPEVALSDYKHIAKEEAEKPSEATEITEKEVEDVLQEIRKSYAQAAAKNKTTDDASATDSAPPNDSETEDLPELTDAFVKTLGNFETVEDFKKQIRENMKEEKEARAREAKRVALGDRLVEATTVTLPQVLVAYELDKMLAQFRDNVERAGMTFEQYLTQANKTEQALREEWKDAAEKRAKLQLILNKIAAEENIHPAKEEVDAQVKHILEQHEDVDENRARVYVETVLTNEAVFRFLEEQKSKKTT